MLGIGLVYNFVFQLGKIGLTLSQTKNLDSSKLKEFADDNFRLDEHGRKFLRAESFFIHSFQKNCTADIKFYRKRCKIHTNCMTVSFNSCKVYPLHRL